MAPLSARAGRALLALTLLPAMAMAEGPHYLFESFAIFNELLLADFLYRQASDAGQRRYYLEQFFDGKGMTLFAAAQDAALEQAIYEGVRQDHIGDADDLDALTARRAARYSIWNAKHTQLNMRWITNSLYYDDPFYNVNYVYGALLALQYYAMYQRDPQGFVPRYIGLLRNGFDAPPARLLRQHLGIDLDDPRLVTDAVQLLDDKLDRLEAEYAGQARAGANGAAVSGQR